LILDIKHSYKQLWSDWYEASSYTGVIESIKLSSRCRGYVINKDFDKTNSVVSELLKFGVGRTKTKQMEVPSFINSQSQMALQKIFL
jgi:hypothetical protein